MLYASISRWPAFHVHSSKLRVSTPQPSTFIDIDAVDVVSVQRWNNVINFANGIERSQLSHVSLQVDFTSFLEGSFSE